MRAKGTNPRFLVLVMAGALLTAFAPAGEGKPDAAWEKMKSLVGEWEGTAEGHPARVRYQLVSNGTALEESLSTADGGDMLSVYHRDGSRLLMTHYCSENNQPRMRAAGLSPDGERIEFSFADATNLSGPDASHMHGLVVTFKDADHFSQTWTHRVDGKDRTGVFEFARKK